MFYYAKLHFFYNIKTAHHPMRRFCSQKGNSNFFLLSSDF